MMNDDSRGDELRRQLEHYNPPPPYPRDSLARALFGDDSERLRVPAPRFGRWRVLHVPAAAALAASLAVFCVGALAGLLLAGGLDSAAGDAFTESSAATPTEGQTDAAGFHRVVWF